MKIIPLRRQEFAYGEVVFADGKPAHLLYFDGLGRAIVSYTSFVYGRLDDIKVVHRSQLDKAVPNAKVER